MNKQLRTLAICGAALVVLCVALAVVLYALPETETPVAETTPAIELIALAEDDVQSIAVTNATGDVLAERGEDGIAIPAFSGYPVDASALSSLVMSAAQLTATRAIEPDELVLADYGLESPRATVAVKTSDGLTLGFSVGDAAPASLGTYVLMDGSVYLVDDSEVTVFEKGPLTYLSLAITPALAEGSELDSIQLSQHGQEISLQYVPEQAITTVVGATPTPTGDSGDEATDTGDQTFPAYYMMDSPVSSPVIYSDVTSWQTGLVGLSARAVAAVAPDAAQLAAFGLDQPSASVHYVTSEGESVTLTAADAGDGTSYVTRSGVDLVYEVSTTSLTWTSVTAETLLHTLFTGLDASDVQSARIESTAGGTHVVQRTEAGPQRDGASIGEDEFATAISSVLNISPSLSDTPAETTLDPVMTVILNLVDGDTRTLQLVPTGTGSLYAIVSGSDLVFTCAESEVATVLAAFEAGDGSGNAATQ